MGRFPPPPELLFSERTTAVLFVLEASPTLISRVASLSTAKSIWAPWVSAAELGSRWSCDGLHCAVRIEWSEHRRSLPDFLEASRSEGRLSVPSWSLPETGGGGGSATSEEQRH